MRVCERCSHCVTYLLYGITINELAIAKTKTHEWCQEGELTGSSSTPPQMLHCLQATAGRDHRPFSETNSLDAASLRSGSIKACPKMAVGAVTGGAATWVCTYLYMWALFWYMVSTVTPCTTAQPFAVALRECVTSHVQKGLCLHKNI